MGRRMDRWVCALDAWVDDSNGWLNTQLSPV